MSYPKLQHQIAINFGFWFGLFVASQGETFAQFRATWIYHKYQIYNRLRGSFALIPSPARHDKSCGLEVRHHLKKSQGLAKLFGCKLLWRKGIYKCF